MAKFRLWRVLLVVGLFLAILLAPIMWQKYQEARRREAAAENLRKIGDAISEHHQRKTAEEAATADASAPAGTGQALGGAGEAVEADTNDGE